MSRVRRGVPHRVSEGHMWSIVDVAFVLWGTGYEALQGAVDLEWVDTGDRVVLYVAGEATGSVMAVDITEPEAPVILSTISSTVDSGTTGLSDLVLVDHGTGWHLVTLGRYDDNFGLFDIDGTGALDPQDPLEDPDGHFAAGMIGTSLRVGQVAYHYVAHRGEPGIKIFRMDATGVTTFMEEVMDTGWAPIGDPTAFATGQLHGQSYMFVASAFDNGIAAFRTLTNGKLFAVDRYLPQEEEGFSGIVALDMVQIGGRAFVLGASAGTDSLFVLRFSAGRDLKFIDSFVDTGETRIANVQAMEVVEWDGRTFVIAGGGDDGVSVFELTYRGQLRRDRWTA